MPNAPHNSPRDAERTAAAQPVDALVAKVQAGQTDAFRGVVDQTLPRVRAFVVSRSLPGVDVDEVVQRAFVEAYRNLADYTVGTNFVAWVVTIARYQLLMETSRLRRQADYHSRLVPRALADEAERQLQAPPGDETDLRLEHLRHCLAKLPDAARSLLRRRYEGCTSIVDIAAGENRSAGSVRKQLFLLRRQLHDCVTNQLNRSLSASSEGFA